jgi:hypothetical protein
MTEPNFLQPGQMRASVAEELGVHSGNGSLFDDRRWGKAGFDIYGDLYDDQPYVEFHVSKLIEDACGIKPRSYVHPRSATLILGVLSKNALSAKENLGIHPGRKTHLHLPKFVQASKSEEAIARSFAVSLTLKARSDGGSNFEIVATTQFLECEIGDSPLIKAMHTELTEMGIPVAFRVREPRLRK